MSDSSIDVAMLLRDITMPLPMRPDWGEDMEWPYPGLPANLVAEFAGHRVAGLPFFTPETVTTDHGSVDRNHHLVEVQRCSAAIILPARVLRPTDKQTVERAFGAARSLLFEQLPGYTGVDVADRGADPESDAILTVNEMEHLIATRIVQVWQTGGWANTPRPGIPAVTTARTLCSPQRCPRAGSHSRFPRPLVLPVRMTKSFQRSQLPPAGDK